jgi:hypothetical protein
MIAEIGQQLALDFDWDSIPYRAPEIAQNALESDSRVPRVQIGYSQPMFPRWEKLISRGHMQWTIANRDLPHVSRAMSHYLTVNPEHVSTHPGKASYDDWWITSETGEIQDSRWIAEYVAVNGPVADPDPDPADDNPEWLDGLGLNATDYAIANRRLEWDRWENKAGAMAARLGVSGEELGKYVAKLVSMAPALNGNRWDYRDELEQSIWLRLIRYDRRCRGNWDKVKLVAGDAFREWYRNHSQEHTGDKVRLSISLDRADFRDAVESGAIDTVISDWESAIDAKWDIRALIYSLPEKMQDVFLKKLADVTLTATERKRLQLFLKTNTGNVLQVLGTGDPVEWAKLARK